MAHKVFIEVRGGMIQNIQSTSADVIIYVRDYDNMDENDDTTGWQYYESKGGDQVVSEDELEDSIVNSDNG